MSGPLTLTFVGGPEDGKRVYLRHPPGSTYTVAIQPPLPTYLPAEAGPADMISFEEFVYYIGRLPGDYNFVAYPMDWRDNPHVNPIERVVTALLRGYVGRL